MSYLNLNGNWQNPETNELEIVERKGIGHPDTLADALAESADATSKFRSRI
jgi:S-adenosylmethionine synthetase